MEAVEKSFVLSEAGEAGLRSRPAYQLFLMSAASCRVKALSYLQP